MQRHRKLEGERALAQRTGLSLRTGARASPSGPGPSPPAGGLSARPFGAWCRTPRGEDPWSRPPVNGPRAGSQVTRLSSGTALGGCPGPATSWALLHALRFFSRRFVLFPGWLRLSKVPSPRGRHALGAEEGPLRLTHSAPRPEPQRPPSRTPTPSRPEPRFFIF